MELLEMKNTITQLSLEYRLDLVSCFWKIEYEKGKIAALEWKNLADTSFTSDQVNISSNKTYGLLHTPGYDTRQRAYHFWGIPSPNLSLQSVMRKHQTKPDWGICYKLSDQHSSGVRKGMTEKVVQIGGD